jgi:hypothetical protein
MANELYRLQLWYLSQCDGDWENSYGVSIETSTIRPGWKLTVQLADTGLQDVEFQTVSIKRSAMDWIHCAVTKMHFQGRGGPQNLIEILGVFLDWGERYQTNRA